VEPTLDVLAPARGINRRTVVSGLAWTVPAIAIAGAAPAVAASTLSPVIAVSSGAALVSAAVTGGSQAGNTGWTPTSTAAGHARSYYVGSNVAGYASGGDPKPGTTTDSAVVATYTFAATAGATYTIMFDCMANFGSPVANAQRQNLEVSASPAGDISTGWPVKVGLAHGNQTAYPSGNTDADRLAQGYKLQAASGSAKTTYSASYKASVTGTVMLTFSFTMLAPTGSLSVWDDLWASTPTVTRG